MATKTTEAGEDGHALPPAGRLPEGGVRFYGWAPDPQRPGSHRLSVHERDPRTGRKTDRDLDRWFGSHEEAEAFVARLNAEAPEPTPEDLLTDALRRVDECLDRAEGAAERLRGEDGRCVRDALDDASEIIARALKGVRG